MSQSLASILIHLVFSTKNREPFIREHIEVELHKYTSTVLANFGSPVLSINGTADHIHLLVALGRTSSIAEVVEEAKIKSSKWIKTKGKEFNGFHWQAGYGAFSIGRSQIGALKRYIGNQKKHHRLRSFQDEYREILAKYEIEFDERYVWD